MWNWASPAVKLFRFLGRTIAFGRGNLYLSPLAIRAFTPVFDGLWRGRIALLRDPGEGASPQALSCKFAFAERPPHPTLSPQAGEGAVPAVDFKSRPVYPDGYQGL